MAQEYFSQMVACSHIHVKQLFTTVLDGEQLLTPCDIAIFSIGLSAHLSVCNV